jgi:REP element-mobilizing transposase RayT
MSRRAVQLALGLQQPKGWGGRRKGAGRKKSRPGSWVPHTTRPWHDENHPVHVTLRVRRHVPNLRGFKLAAVIGNGLRHAAQSTHRRQSKRRKTFRVIHFSIQPNHLHLIVEASSKAALARGMQGLASGLARRVNRKLRRKGSLFGDRYHAHALATPTEVRNGIVYVLKNFEKHPVAIPDRGTEPVEGIDPLSSARWFEGWRHPPPRPAEVAPISQARTWLARVAYRKRGLLGREDKPRTLTPSSLSPAR